MLDMKQRTDMARKKFSRTVCALTAALSLLAGCSKDKIDEKYPLDFTAVINGTEQTRASADGTWNASDYIAVNISGRDVVFWNYGSGDSWTYKKNILQSDAAGAPCWTSTADLSVKAWYFPDSKMGASYTAYPANGVFERSVMPDQSVAEGYYASDFLFAEGTFKFKEANTLRFSHQVSKVTVHILSGDKTPSDITGSSVTGMTIGGSGSGVSLTGRANVADGTWTLVGGDTGVITPMSLGSKTVTVNGVVKNSMATFTALVIPQVFTDEGRTVFVINVTGYAPFYYKAPAEGVAWKSGREQVYCVTIQGNGQLSVTAGGTISWNDGASGSGTVPNQ